MLCLKLIKNRQDTVIQKPVLPQFPLNLDHMPLFWGDGGDGRPLQKVDEIPEDLRGEPGAAEPPRGKAPDS
jgi:hypothetical protein